MNDCDDGPRCAEEHDACDRTERYTASRSSRVPATEFQRNIGAMIYRCVNGNEAITMTNHGRDMVVLVSASEYARLRLAADYAMVGAVAPKG